jgi:hypothetical protein
MSSHEALDGRWVFLGSGGLIGVADADHRRKAKREYTHCSLETRITSSRAHLLADDQPFAPVKVKM